MSKRPKYPHAIVIVTLACNLKCRNCILCAPHYKRPFHPTLEYLKATTERAMRLGDYEIFEFNGGEPLLREDFAELWEYGRRFIDNADVFKTVTNGTLVPGDGLIGVWKSYGEKVYVIVDDYGPKLSPNAREAAEKLKANGIAGELRDMYSEKRHHGGWVDFIAPEKPFRDIEGAKQTYLNCGQAQLLKNCCNIIEGLLMPCHMQFQLNDRGIVKAKDFDEQVIDLFDDAEPFERKREKMALYTDVKRLPYLESCRYCRCLSKDTPRLRPAVQIEGPGDLPFRI
jgi:hypothetical protein